MLHGLNATILESGSAAKERGPDGSRENTAVLQRRED